MLMSRTEGSRALAIVLAIGVSLLGASGAQAKRLPAPAPVVKKPATTVAAPVGLGGAPAAEAKDAQPAKPHDPFWRLRQPRPAPVKQAEAPTSKPEAPRTNVPVMGGSAPAPAPSATTAFKVLN